MKSGSFQSFDARRVPSPCFVVDEAAVEKNLKILQYVERESGAKVLAALKAFSMWSLAPLVNQYLSGTCASGLHEALLAQEYYAGENHVYAAGYSAEDIEQLSRFVDHLVLNSFSQWQLFQKTLLKAKSQREHLSIGLRINPQHSEGEVALYDPCASYSRLGMPVAQFAGQSLEGIDGLHFHTLCEQGVEPLRRTLAVIEERFATYLPDMKWVNFGGGHHITQAGYAIDELIALIRDFSARYGVQVYLEPGEAIAVNTGVLVSEVRDIIWNEKNIAILDCSATCHMPDTLEMPYRADIRGAGPPEDCAYHYRLGGMSCLAGDVMGDYSFDKPLTVGQRLVFDDMSHYTMVKTTTFNGVPLPAIALWHSDTDALRVVKAFTYNDFKSRLS